MYNNYDLLIHSALDGRPPRKVFLDGVEISRCTYADERHGIVKICLDVIDIKNGCLYEISAHGHVVVEYLNDR